VTSMPLQATTADTSRASHCPWPATITTLCASLLFSALAYFQFGLAGSIAVAVFTLTIIGSIWAGAWLSGKVALRHPMLGALAASSGIRMIAPLTAALVIVVYRGALAPIETVYYVVPLYLCSLAADVFVWLREVQPSSTSLLHSNSTLSNGGQLG
jgi:hypothetical protein